MQGVEAMLDQVSLATLQDLGGALPFMWPLAEDCTGWRVLTAWCVPNVHRLVACRMICRTACTLDIPQHVLEVMSQVMLHGTVQLAEVQKDYVSQHELQSILNEVVSTHACMHTHARTPARRHARDKQVARIEPIVLRAKATSAKAEGQQEHVVQKDPRIQGLASADARPTAPAQVLVSDPV